jgi:uncharacterized membrane protein
MTHTYLASIDTIFLLEVNGMSAQGLEALGLSMIVSLALLGSEIVLVGMYLSQRKRGLSRAKLEPYLVVIYLLICISAVAGLLMFYRGEGSTTGLALQSLILISLFPNFVIIVILAVILSRRDK